MDVRSLDWLPNYEIGGDGSIWSLVRAARHRMTAFLDHKGYLRVRLTVGGKERKFLVHRLVCEAFKGKPGVGQVETRHLDGVKINNVYTNLSWGTSADNAKDRKSHGTERAKTNGLGSRKYSKFQPRTVSHHGPIGEAHGCSKLTEQQVREIRAAIKVNELTVVLAARFGVHRATIQKIANGKIWSHVL